MDKEQTVTFILAYLGVPEERKEHVSSVVRGAFDLFPTMLELIQHTRECIEQDYGEKTLEDNS